MLELKITCDTIDEVNIYTNAVSLHNLLGDLRTALRNAQKHGTDADVVRVVQNFFPDITAACDHCQGPY
jgi:3-hydroxyisobutyrate dehydrogenase-like beta-hydroxyacid dehydrogenase